MDETKVPQQINDVVGDNVKKLAQIFPSAVKDGEVDFNALKEELGLIHEVGIEKYELNWAGKSNAKKLAREDVVGRTLKFIPEDSKNADTTENLYIEGDNLEVLKLLRQNYYGAIKMIYIDPPYNTGNDFVYSDVFLENKETSDVTEGAANDFGERFTINKDSQNRYHANWLNMMYSRLILAKDFLRDDGLIFISIDEHEVHNLRHLCDEIFGVHNYISSIVWVKRYTRSNNANKFTTLTETVLCYSKDGTCIDSIKEKRNDKADSIYTNPDNDERGPWTSVSYVNPATKEQRPNLSYSLYNPITKKEIIHPTNAWKYEKKTYEEHVNQNKLYWGKDGQNTYPRLKKFLSEMDGGMVPVDLWSYDESGSTDMASKELESLIGRKIFDFPKPKELIIRMISLLVNGESGEKAIIMDFFSGSATTAHALMQLNAEDEGKRKFIMVQLPEITSENSEAYKAGYKNICEIGKDRIRKAGEKIKKEYPSSNVDIGFKVFRVSDTNIKWNSLMDAGQLDFTQIETNSDQADFMPNANDVDIVYELMLRQRDVALSESLEQLSDIGSRTYLYASSFLVCLETQITEDLIEKLAELDPLPIKFIFRDSAFRDDIALKDETFRRLKALVEKNAGTNKATYTVEFI